LDKLLGTIPKSELEEIWVQIREYRKSVYLDIRVFYRGDPDGQDWRPSGKGVTLKPEQAGELITALESVAKPIRDNSQGNFISGTGGTA